jgi:nucleoside-diphosphate kinase
MPSSRTLCIIKPDAFGSAQTGAIIAHLLKAKFRIRATRVVHLNAETAGQFYAVHKERPFFAPLVRFMTSGPCMPMVLEREDAVAELRRVIGATDPREAAEGTIRKLYAESKERNAIHASDSPENAAAEIAFFFSGFELIEAS